jgi:hypothetical protein
VRTRPVTALLVALAVAVPATPALAAGLSQGATMGTAKHSATKPTKPGKPAKPVKPVKPIKRVSFSYNGTLTAVDADAGTVTIKILGGGHKALRATKLTLTVPASAAVRRNDAAATLGELVVGDKLQVKGDRVGTVHTVRRVSAKASVVAPTPAPTPSPEPSPEPSETPEPIESPTPTPTA